MPAHTESFNINLVEHKMPVPFLKDVRYKDANGNTKTIKGFLGSVKNIKAVDNKQGNFLQPLKINQDEYQNVHMSLSSFFVDNNNTVYGDFFRGTVGANTYTQLFAIPQNQIIPVCHKKQDIQIPIVGKDTNNRKRNQNQEAVKYVNEFVSKNYNNNNQRKVKFFDENDNCLEKIYEKYQKLNKKLEGKDFNTLSASEQTKYDHIVKNEKINFNNGKNFNVEHDELIAVPKDIDYKTCFDCGIITFNPDFPDITSVENINKGLFIQAKCGYPYVVIFNAKSKKLEYKLMSKYIEFLKDNLNKRIKCDTTKIREIERNSWEIKQNVYLVDYLKQINKQIENIIYNDQMTTDVKERRMLEICKESLDKICINGCNQHQDISDYKKKAIKIIEDLQNDLSNCQCDACYYVFAKDKFQNSIDSFRCSDFLEEKNICLEKIKKNNQKIKDIETGIDVKKIEEYEEKQINYILTKKSKEFNCDLSTLKETLKEISKSENLAEQLNCLINYEDEARKKSQKIKKFKYYQQRQNLENKRESYCKLLKKIRGSYEQKERDLNKTKTKNNLKNNKSTHPLTIKN